MAHGASKCSPSHVFEIQSPERTALAASITFLLTYSHPLSIKIFVHTDNTYGLVTKCLWPVGIRSRPLTHPSIHPSICPSTCDGTAASPDHLSPKAHGSGGGLVGQDPGCSQPLLEPHKLGSRCISNPSWTRGAQAAGQQVLRWAKVPQANQAHSGH